MSRFLITAELQAELVGILTKYDRKRKTKEDAMGAGKEMLKQAGYTVDESGQLKLFQVGDVVQLKSGGPLMTVSRITNNDDVICCYFVDYKELQQEGSFPPQALKCVGGRDAS